MLKILSSRGHQGYRTIQFPSDKIKLSKRYRGLPEINFTQCSSDCRRCIEICPIGAITKNTGRLFIDLGECLFCGECQKVCPGNVIRFTQGYSMAVRKRVELMLHGNFLQRVKALDEKGRKVFGRSLKLRQVSAGGCNGCELDTNVLNTVVFDLGSFGIQFVASARHADGILVTGPVTKNMRLALEKTYNAIPSPKLVIAVGACAISGGLFIDHPEVCNGICSIVPVDLYVPGCPPHPLTILDGLLRLLGKI